MKIAYIVQQITDEIIKQRNNSKNRSYAGLQKSNGIKKLLQDCNYEVKIYSPSIVSNDTKKFFKSFYEKDIFHASVLDRKWLNFLSTIFSLIKELFKNRKNFDKIIYYNYSPEIAIPAFFCKIFLNKKIYLEYEDGLDKNEGLRGEVYTFMKFFAKILSDGYILVNENLIYELNDKPYMVANGVFDWGLLQKAQNKGLISNKKKIMITYSGKISDYFGGYELLDYIKNLPKNCELHISGYYWESSIEIEKYIKENNLKNIFWYGLLDDDKYNQLLKDTDYFLLLNEGESKYKDTNFPSKLFVYLSTLKPTISTKKLDYGLSKKCYKYIEKVEDIKKLKLQKNDFYEFKEIEFIYNKQKEDIKKLLEQE